MAAGEGKESLMTMPAPVRGGPKNAANLKAGWTGGSGCRCRQRVHLLAGNVSCPGTVAPSCWEKLPMRLVLHGAGLAWDKGLELGGP